MGRDREGMRSYGEGTNRRVELQPGNVWGQFTDTKSTKLLSADSCHKASQKAQKLKKISSLKSPVAEEGLPAPWGMKSLETHCESLYHFNINKGNRRNSHTIFCRLGLNGWPYKDVKVWLECSTLNMLPAPELRGHPEEWAEKVRAGWRGIVSHVHGKAMHLRAHHSWATCLIYRRLDPSAFSHVWGSWGPWTLMEEMWGRGETNIVFSG